MKREGWKISTLLSSTISHFYVHSNDDKERFLSAKYVRDKCMFIGCSNTQGIEL